MVADNVQMEQGNVEISLSYFGETDIVDNLVILHDTLCGCISSFMDSTAIHMVDNMVIQCTSSFSPRPANSP